MASTFTYPEHIYKVKSHVGIIGNKLVDAASKAVAHSHFDLELSRDQLHIFHTFDIVDTGLYFNDHHNRFHLTATTEPSPGRPTTRIHPIAHYRYKAIVAKVARDYYAKSQPTTLKWRAPDLLGEPSNAFWDHLPDNDIIHGIRLRYTVIHHTNSGWMRADTITPEYCTSTPGCRLSKPWNPRPTNCPHHLIRGMCCHPFIRGEIPCHHDEAAQLILDAFENGNMGS
jgi:hypothetical protein